MGYNFTQDQETKQIGFTVRDGQGNVLTPQGPAFSVSGGGGELLEIRATTPGTVTLGHTSRNNQGIETLVYSVIGGNGERINHAEEITVVFGQPASITAEAIE